jgi:hypothetical protein
LINGIYESSAIKEWPELSIVKVIIRGKGECPGSDDEEPEEWDEEEEE